MALKISVVLLQLKFLGIVPVTRFTEKSGADPGFHEGGGGGGRVPEKADL